MSVSHAFPLVTSTHLICILPTALLFIHSYQARQGVSLLFIFKSSDAEAGRFNLTLRILKVSAVWIEQPGSRQTLAFSFYQKDSSEMPFVLLQCFYCEHAQHYSVLNLWLTSIPQTMKTNKPQFFPQGILAGYSEALHVTTCSPMWMECSVSMWKPGQLESCSVIFSSWVQHFPKSGVLRVAVLEKKSSLRLSLCDLLSSTRHYSIFRFWWSDS